MIERPDIDSTLMAIAQIWEDRSTCSRNSVGAIIAKDGRTISTGYNGAPAGMPHCEHPASIPRPRLSVVTLLAEGPSGPGCREAIHAEANAIAYAARHGVGILGATIYTTLSPCYECAKLIIAAGLVRVVWNRGYRDPSGTDLLQSAGIAIGTVKV